MSKRVRLSKGLGVESIAIKFLWLGLGIFFFLGGGGGEGHVWVRDEGQWYYSQV